MLLRIHQRREDILCQLKLLILPVVELFCNHNVLKRLDEGRSCCFYHFFVFFLCFDYEFQTGRTIIAKKIQGVISKINGLGIYVMTNDGMQYFNYTFLQTEGFSLLADDDMNEYCYLNINKTENSKSKLLISLFFNHCSGRHTMSVLLLPNFLRIFIVWVIPF